MEDKLTLTGRKILNVVGAKKVVSSTNTQAVVELETSTLVISGSNLEVVKLNLTSGEVEFSGNVSNIKFTQKHEKIPLLKRIFK